MKSAKVIAVVALLFLFPLVSYLYLKSGYNFRLKALQDLEPKGQVQSFDFAAYDSADTLTVDALRGKVSLVYKMQGNSIDLLSPVFDEFSHRTEFQMIAITDDTTVVFKSLPVQGKQWIYLNGSYPFEKEMALIDTALNIRNYYFFDSVSLQSLGQHIPIIMPRIKEKDIQMKEPKEL